MKMYKREEEIEGVAVDPLKAVHTVKGVTGREMTHYFFSPDVRFEWESKTFLSIFLLRKNLIHLCLCIPFIFWIKFNSNVGANESTGNDS